MKITITFDRGAGRLISKGGLGTNHFVCASSMTLHAATLEAEACGCANCVLALPYLRSASAALERIEALGKPVFSGPVGRA